MSGDAVKFVTPVGRLVQGSVFEAQTKDRKGNPLTVQSGANKGDPCVKYFIALAILKTDPGWPALWEVLRSTAQRDFPHIFDAAGSCSNPAFAFKVTDGDSNVPDQNNRTPVSREGYPGCYVLKFNTGFYAKCYGKDPAGNYVEMVDQASVKLGSFVQVAGTTKGNDDNQKPGIYLNQTGVQFIGYGEEIAFAASPDEVFGAAPAAVLPVGCSPTPLAPPVAAIGAPGAVQTAPPTAALQAAPTTVLAPPAGVQPAPDFMHPPAGVAPPVAAPPPAAPVAAPAPPPPPAAPVEVRYTGPDGVARTAAELTAAGWLPQQIQALPVAP